MMKHPKLRCTDILFVDPEARKEVYDYVKASKDLLPTFIKENMVRFEHVGSQTFGNSRLSSDWDFNIAMGNWGDQFTARRIFYGNLNGWRKDYEEYFMELRKRTGLKIDLGAVDCDTLKYNICVTLDDEILHHRFSAYPEVFRSDANGIVWELEDKPIDLNKFNETHETPPVANQHLQWNFMIHRWQRFDLNGGRIIPYLNNRKAEWDQDPWASEVSVWQEKYGSRFQAYENVGGVLKGS